MRARVTAPGFARVFAQRSRAGMRRTTIALDALPVMAWVTDLNGAIEYVNDRYLAYTGLVAADVEAAWPTLVFPEDVAKVEKARVGAPAEIEVRLRRHDGTFRWHLVKTAVLLDEDGTPRARVGTATDIDDQKRTAARLEVLQRLTTELVRAPDARAASRTFLDAGIAALDAKSGVVWLVNADNLFELSASRGVPESFLSEWRLLPLDSKQPAFDALRKGEAVWVENAEEYRRVTPDVAEKAERFNRPTAYAAVPLVIDRERLGVAVFGFAGPHRFADTEKHLVLAMCGHAAQALERARLLDAERRASGAVRLLANAGATLSASLDVNATLTALARSAVPDVADWCAVDLLVDGEIRRLTVQHVDPEKIALAIDFAKRWPVKRENGDAVWQVLDTHETLFVPVITDEMLRAGVSDPEKYAALSRLDLRSVILVPLVFDGKPQGVVTFVRSGGSRPYDDSDRALCEEIGRRASLALTNATLYAREQIAAERAEEANRIKDEFLATVSHELRTPLNAIVGWAQMLDGERLEDPAFVRRGLEVIRRNARSQTKIVEEILDVSRIISGKLRLEMSEVDLAVIVREALEAVRPAAAARKIELVSRSTGTTPVFGDAARLQQVAWNLFSNAVKFSAEGGVIGVTVSSDESGAKLTVVDEGEGITADLLPFVFDRFRQGDSSTTRAHGGLGLGLAIVRHIVELHGGRVTAASAGKKKGATFVVTLPSVETAAADFTTPSGRRRGPTPKSSPGMLSGTRVLVVEDDADSRDLIEEVLTRAGADVVSAASVSDAWTALENHERFDVVLSDLGLPDEDGYALVRRLRADDRIKTTFSIALSAYTRPQDRTRALEAGFDLHLAKPVNPNELVLAVARIAR